MQVAKSIQYQSVPLVFLPGPGWIQATGQASTQSATPSQIFVTIVCDTVFSLKVVGFQSLIVEKKVVHNQWLVTLQLLVDGFNHSFAIGLHPGNLSNATTTGILVNSSGIATTQV